MGLGNFLQILSSNFLNVLAWPSFCLMCPLVASIRAVESDKHYQQCLAYWVLFSITTILESVFMKLLIWIPFWPYIKGIATLLLLIPYLDGASYVYGYFISAFVNSQTNGITRDCIVNEQNSFLDAAKRHVNERREKELPKHVIYEDKSTSSIKSSSTWTETPKRFQREWSCALCLVNTSNRKCLRKHMQGKKHKTMEEELRKEQLLVANNKLPEIPWAINTSSSMNLLRWCRWKRPEFGWTKLNTDGSLDRDNAGVGGLFRDYKGDPICAYVSKAPRHNIFMVELWAIWRGLVLGIDMGVKVVWVESDSLSAVNTINKKQSHGPKAESCLKHIWELLKKFEKYKVSHSWRETNRAADHLAKMDLSGSDIVLWPKDFPNSLCKIIKDDAEGKRYRRLTCNKCT